MVNLFDDVKLQEIILRAFQHIFDYMLNATNEKHLVRTSYFETHDEETRHLLNPSNKSNLVLKDSSDSSIYVKD